MKKLGKFLVLSLMLFAAIGLLAACNNDDNGDEVAETDGLFTAGTFTGVGAGYDGEITVEVTFSEDEILEINVVEHTDTAGFAETAIDNIVPNILAAQSTNIDSVSGATYTADGVLEAVADAIRQAGADPADLAPLVGDTGEEIDINTEADVIVVGGGMSGLTTAISAAQNGASVILIEKMPMLGGSTLFGGGLSVAGSDWQIEHGGLITHDELYEGWTNLQVDDPRQVGFLYPELTRQMVDNSGEAFNWLLAMDYQVALHPGGRMLVPETPEDWVGWGGPLLVEFLEEQARDLGVEIHLETRGRDLVMTENGVVTGVVAEGPSGEVTYTAHNAVVLATGGFSRNEELMARLIPELAPFVQYSTAAVGHMGDGVIMAEEAGAVLHEEQWLIGLGLQNEFSGMLVSAVPGILVNHEGNRYVMETRPPGFIDHYTYLYNFTINYSPDGAFFVFDSSEAFETRVEQIEEHGDHPDAFTGETIQALAEAMGVPYENLLAAIDQINAAYNGEADDPFGRDAEGINPITEGPFHAMRLFPMDMGTIGGVITNDGYQVLDANGDVIPGLMAVGEMSNRRYIAPMYFSGLSLMISLQQGIAAGEVAAQ
ncbi:MAG: FAD-dependent oxidoreductase [Turicibacter sp.]|nr:FAD-dependent oxidoreductase [Turicibacter sp.]